MEETQRSRGRPANYKMSRGGVPADFGPFYGIVKNNIDPTKSGRLEVFINAFQDGDEDNPTKWTTVYYLPSFFGNTPVNAAPTGVGQYPGNANSYGMWFTPPDVGVVVLCIFANGDRSQGYYIGVVPEQSIGHMVPAIGASSKFISSNTNQAAYFRGATQLPVTEINTNNVQTEESGTFASQPKPVQSVVAASMFEQGLIKDPERGPITSSSQRESPSAVYGIATPGTPIYQGGLKPGEIQAKVNLGEIKPQDAQVIGRVGGHTFVMDDGDIDGKNRLLRFRTTAGHQITMSDSGDFLYFVHANGLTWMEFGKEGTVDVYAMNSINLRSHGDINFHADRDINMFAGRNFKSKSQNVTQLQADTEMVLYSKSVLTAYSKQAIGIKADGTLGIQSAQGGWNGGSALVFSAGGIDLNGPAGPSISAPTELTTTTLNDTEFSASTGWESKTNALKSIVTRAPTHEPYPYHNLGVNAPVNTAAGNAPPPGSVPMPPGVSIQVN